MTRLLARWREPEQITTEVYTDAEQESYALLELPPVTLISDRMFRRVPSFNERLSACGYRAVERRPDMRGDLYVRPLPLWLLHKVGHGLSNRRYDALHWLVQHGLLTFAHSPAVYPRLRDYRPWPLKGWQDE